MTVTVSSVNLETCSIADHLQEWWCLLDRNSFDTTVKIDFTTVCQKDTQRGVSH